MWLLYWSTELKSSCKHHFLTAVSFCCLNCYFVCLFIALLGRKCCALNRCVSSSLKLHQNYSLALQRHAGQTALLQALTLGHMRSNDYSTTEIFVDNFLLSIMSTNRFSPNIITLKRSCLSVYKLNVQIWSQTPFTKKGHKFKERSQVKERAQVYKVKQW